jgi:putative SOS response-associated peptidase YedK
MCNLFSMTKNRAAIHNLFRVDHDSTGNLPGKPGIFPDYPAPIVRNADSGRELAMERWGMPSSQLALMRAAKKRAAKLEAKASRSISRSCCEWSRIAAPRTFATPAASTGNAGSGRKTAAWCR